MLIVYIDTLNHAIFRIVREYESDFGVVGRHNQNNSIGFESREAWVCTLEKVPKYY
jgi:hypothetical protein